MIKPIKENNRNHHITYDVKIVEKNAQNFLIIHHYIIDIDCMDIH